MEMSETSKTAFRGFNFKPGDIVWVPAPRPSRWERLKHWWHGTQPPKRIKLIVTYSGPVKCGAE